MSLSQFERGVCGVLASVEGFGVRDFGKVRQFFGGLNDVLNAKKIDLVEAGFSEKKVVRVLQRLSEVEPERYLESLEARGIRVLVYGDKEYPSLLAEAAQAPYVLFMRGELKPEDEVAIAVVGTRKPSVYGKDVTERLVSGLVAEGVTVVSGLAYGVDGVAHRAALEAGGRTVAVLGNGIDRVNPVVHKGLAERILEQGAIVSEYAPGIPSRVQNFPARNRIVAGMSLGVLVIEGTEKSGTLITAEFARKQGRELFAVPGAITNPLSVAPNGLIREGAVLVRSVDDVLERLQSYSQQDAKRSKISSLKKQDFGNELEWRVFSAIVAGEGRVDMIVREVGASAAEVTATLMVLELQGVVKQAEPMVYGLI